MVTCEVKKPRHGSKEQYIREGIAEKGGRRWGEIGDDREL